MTEREREVNLLLLENKHYVLINDLSRLLTSQMTNHTEKRFFCLRCLNSFTKKEVLDRHREYCGKHDFVKISMPEKGSQVWKPQAFDESPHCGLCRLWVHEKNNSKLSTKFRILIYRTISKARTLRFLLLYCLRREKNWNRFWFQNNLRMKTWLKYFVKVFGTNTVPYYYGSPARPLNYNIVSKTFRYGQNM